ncbi:MAG: trypsin-like serine peptidase [Elainellaceae cyanobacterium]
MNWTSKLSKFTLSLILGAAISLLLSISANLLPTPASAQFQPTSVPDLPAASTAPSSLADLNFAVEIDAFVPPELPQSDSPVEGGRGIIGPDNRLPMTSSAYPWSAIGRILSLTPLGDEQFAVSACTGTLIQIDMVLTNAHCVVDPATHEFKQSVYFQPNLVNGQLQNEEDLAIATTVWAATDFREDNIPPNADDWALLKLDKPLGDTYGTIEWRPLPLETLVEEYQEKLILAGYSGDFPADNPGETAGVHEGCSIFGDYEDSVIHDYDTTSGASGGPILAEVDSKMRILAVNSAEQTELLTQEGHSEPRRVGVVNYAVQISRIVETLVAQQGR